MLKADLHLHCSADPFDLVEHSDKELIYHASKLGYNVLSITCHNTQHYTNEIIDYAKKKGILLIPGMEKTIEGKHVLLYNFEEQELNKIKKIKDIQKYKRTDNLVIAPHPFLPIPQSLLLKYIRHHKIFDGAEYCHLYTKMTNYNLITKNVFKKPMIGNSDAHFLWQMGRNYTLINSKQKINSIIQAIKENQVKICSKPLTGWEFVRESIKILNATGKSFLKLNNSNRMNA